MTNQKNSLNGIDFVWITPFLAPVFTLLFDFLLRKWSWGLMDDAIILDQGANAAERVITYFQSTLAFGQFKPLYAAYTGIFYSIFENAPHYFYVFKLGLAALVLMLWGVAAYMITGQKLACLLVPVITLSFHYFYDVFFYLSSHEIVGLFFASLSVICFIQFFRIIIQAQESKQAVKGIFKWLFFGGLLLFCAFCSKEPFVACGIAIGLSFIGGSFLFKEKKLRYLVFWTGLGITGLSLLHAILITICVKSNYTAGYSLTDFNKISGNVMSWAKKDLSNHVPWIFAAIVIFFKVRGSDLKYSIMTQWGILLSVLLYGLYLCILLPWLTVTYYAAPLGLFFALLITIMLVKRMVALSAFWKIVLVIIALSFNQLVCQYALLRESTYQTDTQNLISWLSDSQRQIKGNEVLSNAMEPAGAIPALANRLNQTQMTSFQYSFNPNEVINGRRSDYYLYSPRFGSLDLSELNQKWDKVFYSKNWIMYKRKI